MCVPTLPKIFRPVTRNILVVVFLFGLMANHSHLRILVGR